MQPRDYQRQALDALYSHWEKEGGNALIVLPTGSGKSLVLALLCQEILKLYPSMRIVIATHVHELIKQDFDEMSKVWPFAPTGIYSAGIGRRDTQNQILFCGIQSVFNKIKQIGAFDLLIVDEAHLISKKAETMYGKFIAALRTVTPDLRIVGLTATPFRLDSGRLDRGENKIFDQIVYEANLRDLIEQGWLCRPVSKATVTQLDVTGVGKRGGDFIPGELEIAVDKEWITREAVREIVQYGENRRAWLAFCSGVDHAFHIRDEMRKHGIVAQTIIGETPKAERREVVEAFRRGEIRCLTSVGVLGTGFNVPHVDLIALLRPTQSPGLFVQQVGRGLRNAEGKENCLVLDFARNTLRHGPIDMVTAPSGKGEGPPPTKECPNPKCRSIIPLNATICPDCGHEFPHRELERVPKHTAVADATTSIMSSAPPQWIAVDDVRYYRHNKIGSQPSLRVEYDCGFLVYKEWVCLEHRGFARTKAERWWRDAACGTEAPDSVDDALLYVDELECPSEILVRPNGRFFEVVGRRYNAYEKEAV